MDTRLESALELSKALETIENQRSLALSKYQQNLILYYNGGTFVVDLVFLSALSSFNDINDAIILLDINNIPVKVTNLEEFIFVARSKYIEASRQYYSDYESIKKIRTPRGILEK